MSWISRSFIAYDREYHCHRHLHYHPHMYFHFHFLLHLHFHIHIHFHLHPHVHFHFHPPHSHLHSLFHSHFYSHHHPYPYFHSHSLDVAVAVQLRVTVKKATKNVQLFLEHCCKTSWIAMLRVLPPTKTNLATLFIARQVRTWVVKRATSVFNWFCSNVAKRVARFLLPVLL